MQKVDTDQNWHSQFCLVLTYVKIKHYVNYIKSLFICKITAAEKHAGGSDKSHTVKHSTGDS